MYDLSDSIKRHQNAGIVCLRCEHNKANGIQPTPHAGYDSVATLVRHTNAQRQHDTPETYALVHPSDTYDRHYNSKGQLARLRYA